ncbi:MAG: Crp/Fnr family transcriptional regulator [Clostridia bacterium]|nr:Crp/Fnr family transcriptional regulator [Clostridia bacterium]
MKSSLPTASKLRALPLFATAKKDHLGVLLASGTVREFAAGETIAESEGRQLGILLSGRAEIRSVDPVRTVVLRTLLENDIFGAAALFCPDDAALSRIEAVSDCTCLFFDAASVRALLQTDSGFLDRYLSFLAGRVRFLNRKILCFTAGSAERRLALWLLSEERDTVTLPATLTVLADMLDIGRASLYRALDKLSDEGFIARRGREIRLLDPNALREAYR